MTMGTFSLRVNDNLLIKSRVLGYSGGSYKQVD